MTKNVNFIHHVEKVVHAIDIKIQLSVLFMFVSISED